MKKISDFLLRFSTHWVALAALLIFFTFSVLTLPGETKRTEMYGQGIGSPDTSLFFSGDQLLTIADTYGEVGRAAYIKARWTFDLAFPIIYTGFFLTSISFVLKKVVSEDSKLRQLNLIPFLGMIFDLAENSATTSVMSAYPGQNPVGLMLAQVFTPIKWLFVGLSMILLILLLLAWLVKAVTFIRK